MKLKKRNDVYQYDFWRQGIRYRESTHTANKEQAKKIMLARIAELAGERAGIAPIKEVPTFVEATKVFLHWSKQEHLEKPATWRRQVTASHALLVHFEKKRLDLISALDAETYKTERATEVKYVKIRNVRKVNKAGAVVSKATINRELSLLRQIVNHFIKDRLPLINPVSKAGAHLHSEGFGHDRVLDRDDVARYLELARDFKSQKMEAGYLYDYAVVSLDLGMRPEEVCQMVEERCHFDVLQAKQRRLVDYYDVPGKRSSATEERSFSKTGKTNAAKRRLYLTPEVKAILQRRISNKKGPWIFHNLHDPKRPLLRINNVHRRFLASIGMEEFVPYSWRHTFATRMIESGADLISVSRMLGHEKLDMVLRYVNPSQEHILTAFEKKQRFEQERAALLDEGPNGNDFMASELSRALSTLLSLDLSQLSLKQLEPFVAEYQRKQRTTVEGQKRTRFLSVDAF